MVCPTAEGMERFGGGAHLQGFWLGGLGAWPEDQHLAGLQDFT